MIECLRAFHHGGLFSRVSGAISGGLETGQGPKRTRGFLTPFIPSFEFAMNLNTSNGERNVQTYHGSV